MISADLVPRDLTGGSRTSAQIPMIATDRLYSISRVDDDGGRGEEEGGLPPPHRTRNSFRMMIRTTRERTGLMFGTHRCPLPPSDIPFLPKRRTKLWRFLGGDYPL
ncbi:hypothetical protein EVAR_20364_1 [Eumeta japonica]|uniref:Uncharacterized protein n=1 Tax=Eumeta variegata TaxID=151549 RepID=A0A4C1VQZ7_EUMVA|nr:hypothetical protein EVAR_20364_1 [Eumeta japonica]